MLHLSPAITAYCCLLALLLGAALTAAVILLCALCYYHLTPAGHLPPEPWGGLPLGWIGGNHA